MANSELRVYGVTAPLSIALPTENEIARTNSLVEELRRQNNYESAAETAKRTVVLESLQAITEEFVKQVCRAQGMSEKVANAAGGKICTYGSFRLGVYGPGSDIDTLVVAPKNVEKDDYFKYYPDLLLKMAPKGSITDLTVVPDAFVPIIKFEYSGISIDLIFASIYLEQVPKNLSLQGQDMLRGLDESGVRSLNGTRVTDEILTLVPQTGVFRTALRGVKLWAQRRAIYANIMGFPGGVAWAMLVARICQLYPKAAASTIVLKFFRLMERWQWPSPVLLKAIEPGQSQLRQWNPKIYYQDQYHLMPIITPAFPSMCATHNVTRSTLKVIKRELKRGGDITDKVMQGQLPWKELFSKNTFFPKDYKYYLSVIASSTSEETQLVWSGTVESKVRFLCGYLDDHPSIAIACPFNKGFERKHKCRTDEEIEKAKTCLDYQVKDSPEVAESKEKQSNGGTVIKEEIKEEKIVIKEEENDTQEAATVYTTTYYVGLELEEGAKQLDLSFEVDKFKAQCIRWDKYNQDLMALNVVHTKNLDLPDDVFAEGEVKPTRSSKKKTGVTSKKRAATESTGNTAKKQQTAVTAAS